MRPKSALVFDDNLICRTFFSDILDEQNFAVTSFADPTLFLTDHDYEYCPADHPCVDLIITDNQMPGMTGLEFLEQLKQKGCKVPDQRKAIISGNWSSEQVTRAEKIGCKVFHKPTPMDELHAWLEE